MDNLWIITMDIYIFPDIYIYLNRSGWWLNPTPLKNMKVNWDDEIPNIWKNRKCSKPPTSWVLGTWSDTMYPWVYPRISKPSIVFMIDITLDLRISLALYDGYEMIPTSWRNIEGHICSLDYSSGLELVYDWFNIKILNIMARHWSKHLVMRPSMYWWNILWMQPGSLCSFVVKTISVLACCMMMQECCDSLQSWPNGRDPMWSLPY